MLVSMVAVAAAVALTTCMSLQRSDSHAPCMKLPLTPMATCITRCGRDPKKHGLAGSPTSGYEVGVRSWSWCRGGGAVVMGLWAGDEW